MGELMGAEFFYEVRILSPFYDLDSPIVWSGVEGGGAGGYGVLRQDSDPESLLRLGLPRGRWQLPGS
jgi:hypothetical protein